MNRTNEEQLDLFADLLEPLAAIFSDGEIAAIFQNGGTVGGVVAKAIRKHKEEVVQILAVLDGEDPAEYRVPGLLALFKKAIGFFNDPEMKDLFPMPAQKRNAASSGSAMATTEGGEN